MNQANDFADQSHDFLIIISHRLKENIINLNSYQGHYSVIQLLIGVMFIHQVLVKKRNTYQSQHLNI